jgi:transcriptional regulator with XRE-family HTH domain
MSIPPFATLAQRREAAGFTQESFADRIGVDRTTIGRWERGVQQPQPWQRPLIGFVLTLTLDEVDDALRATIARRTNPARGARAKSVARKATLSPNLSATGSGSLAPEAAIHSSIPRLRQALNSFDAPGDGAVRPLGELAAAVRRLTAHRLEARYQEMGQELPDLIAEVSRAVHRATGQEQAQTARLLTLAYRAADGMAYKLGYLDLSARIIDRMRSAACLAQDPALLATCAYVRTETFFATGDLDAAARSLAKATDDLAAARMTSQTAIAAYGALHMRAAVVAGRAGKRDTAWEHLGEARRVARDVPDGVYLGTAFGPSSVRVHHLAVAVELRDNPAAVEQASAWSPPPSLPAERRSHYFIDLAVAQADIGFHHDACQSLQTARQIAPQHAHDHPRVRDTLQVLLHDHRSHGTGILELAIWAGVS